MILLASRILVPRILFSRRVILVPRTHFFLGFIGLAARDFFASRSDSLGSWARCCLAALGELVKRRKSRRRERDTTNDDHIQIAQTNDSVLDKNNKTKQTNNNNKTTRTPRRNITDKLQSGASFFFASRIPVPRVLFSRRVLLVPWPHSFLGFIGLAARDLLASRSDSLGSWVNQSALFRQRQNT